MAKQHPTKPCKTCPFRVDAPPGELGGSPSFRFIGQAFGPFYLPCHAQPGYDTLADDQLECAGAAIFRANCGLPPVKGLHVLPPGPEAFSSPATFLAYHESVTLDAADELLKRVTPERLCQIELQRSSNRLILRKKAQDEANGSADDSSGK